MGKSSGNFFDFLLPKSKIGSMKKSVIIVVIVLILGGLYFSNKQPQDTSTIKIGGNFILSGSQALVGELQKNATTMAIEKINSDGGINGKKLELVLEDSAYDSKTSLNAYKALSVRGINYIIADGSPVVSSIREVAVKDGNVLIVPGATTPTYFDGSNLSCRIALTAKTLAPAFVELMKKSGYKKVATLLPDNEYGRGVASELHKNIDSISGEIVIEEFYNATPGANDYRTNILKIKGEQNNIDTVIAVQVANTVEAMLGQIKEVGLMKPIISDYYTVQNPALKNLALANNVDYVDYEYSRDGSVTESDITKKFKQDYKDKFGSNPVYLAAAHYDVVNILAHALREVGDNPQKVADYISSMKNYQAVTGTLSFDDDCEVERATVFRTVVDGKIIDLP